MDLEVAAMQLVGNAGDSRSLSFEALTQAKLGNYQKARDLLNESKKAVLKAHEVQTELICMEADGKSIANNLLMVHAQDHLMTAMLAKDLIEEMIELHEKLESK